MTLPRLRRFAAAAVLAACTQASPLHANDAPGFTFSLLPKSFQRNPLLDFNIRTELSTEGKKRPQPTAENPAYYVLHVTPHEMRGLAPDAPNKHTPTQEQIGTLVTESLRATHHRPLSEKPDARPSLVVYIHYGTYSSPAFGGDDMADVDAPSSGATATELLPLVLNDIAKRKAIIERAKLIGGDAFALALNGALNQEVEQQRVASSSDSARAAALLGSTGSTESDASSLSDLLSGSSPLRMFMRRDDKIAQLVEEVFSSSYYIVVSAMDYDSIAKGKPVPLWRTKMSLNSIGVSLRESAGPLVKASAAHFGRATESTVIVSKRLRRAGSVKVGEAEVVETHAPTPTPTPASAPRTP